MAAAYLTIDQVVDLLTWSFDLNLCAVAARARGLSGSVLDERGRQKVCLTDAIRAANPLIQSSGGTRCRTFLR